MIYWGLKIFSFSLILKIKLHTVSNHGNHDIMRQESEWKWKSGNWKKCLSYDLGELAIFKGSQPDELADICQTTCHLTCIK